MRLPLRAAAVAALAALVAATGTAVHLVAELAGAGIDTLLAPRHAYLLGVLTVAFLTLAAAVRASGVDRRSASLLVRALPWGGRGLRYTAMLGLGQFAFFALTTAGEGSPLAAGNLLLGIGVAAVASALAAFVVATFATHIIAVVAGIVAPLGVSPRNPSFRHPGRLVRARSTPEPYVLFRPNRAPPTILASR